MQLVTELAEDMIQWMDFKLSVVIIYWFPLKAMGIFCQLKNSLYLLGGRVFIMKLVAGFWVVE
jgi:hypothetical protein